MEKYSYVQRLALLVISLAYIVLEIIDITIDLGALTLWIYLFIVATFFVMGIFMLYQAIKKFEGIGHPELLLLSIGGIGLTVGKVVEYNLPLLNVSLSEGGLSVISLALALTLYGVVYHYGK